MKKSSVIIKSGAFRLKVLGHQDILSQLKSFNFLYEYIPNVSMSVSWRKKEDITLVLESRLEKNKIEINDHGARLYGNYDLHDLVTLAEYLFEKERQKQGVYCFHGSSVVLDKKGVLLWGPSTNIGKTTVVLDAHNNGWGQLYSDEKILVNSNSLKLAGGIKKLVFDKKPLREKFNINNMGLKSNKNYNKIISLNLFVYPVLTDTTEGFCEIWNKEEIVWHLYEELSRKIRGTSRRFFGGTYPINSIDNRNISKGRINAVERFAQKIKFIHVKGNIDYIKRMIQENL